MLLVNIRDDDTNFFTKPEEITEAYGHYLGEIPITLACTPFVSEHSFLMEKLSGDRAQQFCQLNEIELNFDARELADINRVYPLGDNESLVLFLSNLVQENKLEIAIHGYTHRFYPDGAEFVNGHINFYNVRDAKSYLSKLFGRNINLFVPPSNKIDYEAFKNINLNNVDLVTSGKIDFHSHIQAFGFYSELFFNGFLKVKHLANKRMPNFFNFQGNNCIRSKTFRLDDNVDSFLKRNKISLLEDNFISVATHYTTLVENGIYRKRFYDLIESFKNNFETKFVTLSDVLEAKR